MNFKLQPQTKIFSFQSARSIPSKYLWLAFLANLTDSIGKSEYTEVKIAGVKVWVDNAIK